MYLQSTSGTFPGGHLRDCSDGSVHRFVRNRGVNQEGAIVSTGHDRHGDDGHCDDRNRRASQTVRPREGEQNDSYHRSLIYYRKRYRAISQSFSVIARYVPQDTGSGGRLRLHRNSRGSGMIARPRRRRTRSESGGRYHHLRSSRWRRHAVPRRNRATR